MMKFCHRNILPPDISMDAGRFFVSPTFPHLHQSAQPRHKMKYRHKFSTRRMSVANRTSIRERSAEADGERFGEWKMDLIVDSFGHATLTLMEPSTNMLLMRKLPSRDESELIAKEVSNQLLPYKKNC